MLKEHHFSDPDHSSIPTRCAQRGISILSVCNYNWTNLGKPWMFMNSTNNSDNLPCGEFTCAPAVVFDCLVKLSTETNFKSKITHPRRVTIWIQSMNQLHVLQLLHKMLLGHWICSLCSFCGHFCPFNWTKFVFSFSLLSFMFSADQLEVNWWFYQLDIFQYELSSPRSSHEHVNSF